MDRVSQDCDDGGLANRNPFALAAQRRCEVPRRREPRGARGRSTLRRCLLAMFFPPSSGKFELISGNIESERVARGACSPQRF